MSLSNICTYVRYFDEEGINIISEITGFDYMQVKTKIKYCDLHYLQRMPNGKFYLVKDVGFGVRELNWKSFINEV